MSPAAGASTGLSSAMSISSAEPAGAQSAFMPAVRRLDSSEPGFDAKLSAVLAWEASQDAAIERVVADIVADVRARGDAAVLEYTRRFDRVQVSDPAALELPQAALQAALDGLPAAQRQALEAAAERVRTYHTHQRAQSWSYVEADGTRLGQKVGPIERVGLYVPGGKAAYPSSVLMNALPAKVAGVPQLIMVCPTPDGVRNPMVLAAAAIAGVDRVFTIGGAQAVAALAYGTATVPAVDKIVGPGNAYVAEAKRQLYGRVGIDLFAGPTETLLIVDETVDGELCATDLLGQAEHGYNSPAVLITNSRRLAEATMAEVDRLLKILPTAETASASWRDYGEVILCDTYEEMLSEANFVASEHVQIMTDRDDWFLDHMHSYGALFLGPRTNVANGDKVIGTNHTLPTRKAGRYTGGLWVGKFLKTHSYQRITTDEAAAEIGAYGSRLCMLEGFVGHAEQCNIRVRRYGKRNIPYGEAAE